MNTQTSVVTFPSSSDSMHSFALNKLDPHHLYFENEHIINTIAHNYSNGDNYLYDDLKQEGYFAFLKTIQCYDPSRGASFSTYLYHKVQGAIKDFLKKNFKQTKNINLHDLCENEAEGIFMSENIPFYEMEVDILDPIDVEMYRDKLSIAMNNLTVREKEVINKHFFIGLNVTQIAIDLEITKARVSKVIKKAIKKLSKNIYN